jgi:hypothetical protein
MSDDVSAQAEKIVPLFFFAVFINISIRMHITNYMRCCEF